ncbi:phage major capsid protein [Streptomyces sp. MZ04]|uniref:phage major capsid protein n=1 Tax=Streptomyces sp. MZ04 TaxID=2559236 RepID=UPI00107EC870|nr:phage major capsid protein [Streptomyces sp. MZ04]TGB12619.1 phage major capsid protein [Streptomyces sp. MZ04]
MPIQFPALEAVHAERDQLATEARTLLTRSSETLSDEDTARFTEIETRLTELKTQEDKLLPLARLIESGNYATENGTPRSDGGDRGGSLKDSVMRVLDADIKRRILPEYAAERVEKLMTIGTEQSQTLSQRWAAAAGDPEYLNAFAKQMADPVRGHLLWTEREAHAYRNVAEVRTALGLGSGGGATMVPLTLDPAIMLTNDGSINPLRRISRVVQTASNTWQGVTSAGASAEWKAEGAQAADGTPALAGPEIPVHLGDVDVIYSYEVGMDALNFAQEMQGVMMDAADNLAVAAYTTGSGSGQPKGIVTALAGTASELNSGGSEALIAADAFTVQNALPARFSANAQWCAHIATINTLRQFETTNGSLKFPELAGNPPYLLTKTMNELSNMDGSVNAAATANNYLLLYGDFNQFVIVDRIGATVEILPGYGANQRPTAQRHAFLTFRTGSDVVVPQAFRLLDVPTTA